MNIWNQCFTIAAGPNKRVITASASAAGSDNKRFTCTQCQQQFSQQGHLKRHVEYKHLDVRRHVCDVCQKAFHSKQILQQHMLTHKQYVHSDYWRAVYIHNIHTTYIIYIVLLRRSVMCTTILNCIVTLITHFCYYDFRLRFTTDGRHK